VAQETENNDANTALTVLQDMDLGNLLRDQSFRELCLEQLKELGCKPPANKLVLAALTPVVGKTGNLVAKHVTGRALAFLANKNLSKKLTEWLLNTVARAGSNKAYRVEIEQRLAANTSGAFNVRTDSTWTTQELATLDIQQSLADIHGDLARYADEFSAMFNRQNAPGFQTFSEPPTSEARRAQRFHFKRRIDKFVGREDELALINNFANRVRGSDAKNRFSWLLVTAPGGTGKSRLALEAVGRLEYGWQAGFVDMSTLENSRIDNWQPDEPTFMVIDYASHHPELVKKLIDQLGNACQDYYYPVRVLLLERQASGTWYDDLFSPAGGDSMERWNRRYRDPAKIGALEDADLAAMMQARIAAIPESSKTFTDADLIDTLTRVDPKKRPLFATITADEMARSDTPEPLNRANVFAKFLAREEREYWRPHAGANQLQHHKHVLALATLCQGAPILVMENPPPPETKLPHDMGDGDRQYNPDLMNILNGEDNTNRLAPLQPDLIGEFFVLSHLQTLPQRQRQALIDLAWQQNGLGTANFLMLAATDYPDDLANADFLAPSSTMPDETQLWFARVQINLITILGRSGFLNEAQKLHAQIRERAESSQNPEIQLRVTKGAVNLILAYGNTGKAGQLVKAEALHTWLLDQAKTSQKPEIQLEAAKAAVNLIIAYGKTGKPDQLVKAEALHTWLLDQAKTSENPEIQFAAAKGAVNLIVDYGNTGKADQLVKAEALHTWLLDQAKTSQNPEIQLEAAKGAFNLIFAYGKTVDADQLVKAEALHTWLLDQAKTSQKPEIQLLAAKGAVNLIVAYCKTVDADQLVKAEVLHTWLLDQAKTSGNPEIQFCSAKGAGALWVGFGMTLTEARVVGIAREMHWLFGYAVANEDMNMVHASYGPLKDISEHYPDNGEIQAIWQAVSDMLK